jgi:hypothetical protein
VGADVRADLCFTLHHLARAGVTEVADSPIHTIISGLLADIDGAGTHTFFSYRIAEMLLAHGPFAGNPLLANLGDDQVHQVALAVDSSDWLELLDAGVLPRNYAGVLARCELGRVRLGLVDDTTRLDGLIERVRGVLGTNPLGALDDSNDASGRYDIYTADDWLFTEPLADRNGEVWTRGIASALDLVMAVGGPDGSSVPWGRSTGDLSDALTLELAAFALTDRSHAAAGVCAPSPRCDAHLETRLRPQRATGQRAPRTPTGRRRLQLTYDLLGKLAWSAAALRRVDPDLAKHPLREAYPQSIGSFHSRAPSGGVWAHRSPGPALSSRLSAPRAATHLPALHRPGGGRCPSTATCPPGRRSSSTG